MHVNKDKDKKIKRYFFLREQKDKEIFF